MGANKDKPDQWKADIWKSVDQYNDWFLACAPVAFREQRIVATKHVENHLVGTDYFRKITAADLKANPEMLMTLRMACCPPIARDRLSGLAYVEGDLVKVMEIQKRIYNPRGRSVDDELSRVAGVIYKLLDREIMEWLQESRDPTRKEMDRAAQIIADRLCGSLTDPIIRNAQEARQIAVVEEFLKGKGYTKLEPGGKDRELDIKKMAPGTYSFRTSVVGGKDRQVKTPVDVVIQPKVLRPSHVPLLVECKSAGDFVNPNKRRKEEADKSVKLDATFGETLVVFLCGYFNAAYLGNTAADRMDWVWEHRVSDFELLGV